MKHLTPEQRDYFVSRLSNFYAVDSNDCWVWHGRRSNGSPFITLNWDKQRVHFSVRRFLYTTTHPETKVRRYDPIYTTCGNPDCVNPAHLAVGHGAGTNKGETVAGVLKRYFALKNSTVGKLKMKNACAELCISFATLKRYLAMYDDDPAKWQRIWGRDG